jgi:OOP family OmpA-OmpF porin
MKLNRGISFSILAATAILTLSGCGFKSHSEVQALNEVQSVGSPFAQALATEYRSLANGLQNQVMDHPDSLHFARKGLTSAKGEVVLPEPIADWNLRPQHIDELAPARNGLIAALDRGAREQNPQIAAAAQAKFDCWIEQQERNWGKDGSVSCKNEFFNLLNQLGAIPMAAAPEIVPAPVADIMAPISPMAPPTTPMAAADAKYIVFFDFDKSQIDQGGGQVVDGAAQEIARQQLSSVLITGNTDTSGSDRYNQRLGMKRANAVREALVARGVSGSMLQVESRGESELMVATPDGVREPANRRTEITFVK